MSKKHTSSPTYAAPALEKGIDVIEYLAQAERPLSLTEIAVGIGRSKSEIFRMVAVLEKRALIERSGGVDAYRITDKLFSLRLRRADTRQLISVAIPQMEEFSRRTSQSCHIAVRVADEIVVIAKVEAVGKISVSVPIGHRRALVDSPSGKCILSLASERDVDDVIALFGKLPNGQTVGTLKAELAAIRADGYCILRNGFAKGIVGVSAPVTNLITGKADAAVTTTLLQTVSDMLPRSRRNRADSARHGSYNLTRSNHA